MKFRQCFVANSSSSSCIILGPKEKIDKVLDSFEDKNKKKILREFLRLMNKEKIVKIKKGNMAYFGIYTNDMMNFDDVEEEWFYNKYPEDVVEEFIKEINKQNDCFAMMVD